VADEGAPGQGARWHPHRRQAASPAPEPSEPDDA
jgi:hypothetical protein